MACDTKRWLEECTAQQPIGAGGRLRSHSAPGIHEGGGLSGLGSRVSGLGSWVSGSRGLGSRVSALGSTPGTWPTRG
eukprot:1188432-Prorocentrum_minimum.AAC.5